MVISISEKEEHLIKSHLALAPIPEIAFSYYNLLGYVYGIAITPHRIAPSEWIPIIFGDEAPEHTNKVQTSRMIQTLLTLLHKHISAFQQETLTMPFDMKSLDPTSISNIWEWTAGFEEALALRPQCWEEDYEGMSESEQGQLVNSLIVIEGVAYPDEAMDMFDHIPENELQELGITLEADEIDKVMQAQDFLLQGLEQAVITIQHFAVMNDRRRLQDLHSTSAPFPGRSSAVQKNEPCPCGSERAYSKCCGSSRGQMDTIAGQGKKESSGKIIKVDFAKNRKVIPQKSIPDITSSYQLEISLAYSEPPIWRRVMVPGTFTLADLHQIIQYSMGWQNVHLHHFQIGTKFYGPPSADDYGEMPILDESRYLLDQLEMDLLRGILYTYDFGDAWEHVVMLERVVPGSEAISSPVLLEGVRACPPEDIGGMPGYQYFLDVLADPANEDYEELVNLPGLKGYDPDHLNIDAINTLLQYLYDPK